MDSGILSGDGVTCFYYSYKLFLYFPSVGDLVISECPHNEIYFLALIDILTHYGVKKRTAQAAKTVKHGAGAEISTVAPDQYARRFLEFVEKIVIV